MHDAVGVFDPAVAGKAVEHEGETLVAFHIAGTLEVFIEHGADQILRRGDEACDRDFIGHVAADQAVVVSEIDRHPHELRCARGRRR